MKIGVAGDHAGYEYKNRLAELLTKKGHDVADYGTYSDVSCDYPDYAHALAEAVQKKEVEVGIAICGTGNGMAITLNKHQGIRAGLAWNSEVGRLVKAHNDANVLADGHPHRQHLALHSSRRRTSRAQERENRSQIIGHQSSDS